MAGLIHELQASAWKKSGNLSDLLRMALVVAKKLDLVEFEDWVQKELNGYPRNNQLPDYRKLHGRVEADNHPYGWIPVTFSDAISEANVSVIPYPNAIASLDEIMTRSDQAGTSIHFSFPPALEQSLRKATREYTQFRLTIDRSQIGVVLDRVRNIVLEWSLKLEKEGIVGEGMSFTKDEHAKAQKKSASFHATNITYIEQMSESQIQQGTESSTQQYSYSKGDLKQIEAFINNLLRTLNTLAFTDDQRTSIKLEAETIQTECSSTKPSSGIIRAALSTIRGVLEHAAGHAIGAGIPTLLHQITQLLQ